MTSSLVTHPQPVPQQPPHAEPWDLVEVPPIVDTRDLKSIVRKNFKMLFAIPVICVMAALFYLYVLATPMYKSSALLFVDPKFDGILQIENVQSIASDLDSLNSLEKAITSDSMLIRVINRLDLRKDLGFLPKELRKKVKKGEEISDSLLLSKIRGKRVSASLIRPTRLLELSVLDFDPVRAQQIADVFVEEFEVFLGEQRREEAENSEVGLREQAELAYTRALESEKLLENYRKENPELTVEQDHQLFAERLSKVGDELNTASGETMDLRSRAETLRHLDPESDPVGVIEAGKFSGLKQVSDLLDRRAAAKSNLSAAEAKYSPSHPSYQQALTQLKDAEAQLKHFASELKAAVESSLEVAERNEELLAARVKELQASLSGVKTASAKFRAIQQKVETEWLIHENLQTKIGLNSLSTEKSTAITTVMSEPIIPHKPAKPSKPLTVLVAGFLGSFMSVGLVALKLVQGGPYVERRQVEEHLNLRTIAQIPAVGSEENTDTNLINEMSKVFYSPEHRQARLLHVTSVSDCPDGLRISTCLASVSAFHGCPTLLITVLKGEHSNEIVSFTPRPSRTENLYTLTLSSDFLVTQSSASQVFGPTCQNFGRIVVESTALPQSSQVPSVLTSFADSNLLVVSMKNDERSEVKEVSAQLSRHSKTPISLVLQG